MIHYWCNNDCDEIHVDGVRGIVWFCKHPKVYIHTHAHTERQTDGQTELNVSVILVATD